MHQPELPSLVSRPVSSRRGILQQFWDNKNCGPQIQENCSKDDSYFEYFENQCRLASQNDGQGSQLVRLQNICFIVQKIKAGDTRETIKCDLAKKLDREDEQDDEILNNMIDLAVRLYLMVHIGQVQRGVTGQTAISWKEGSVKASIDNHFQHQLILSDSVKFEKAFNVRNIERIADVRIQWTPNLVDHLRFIEDGKKPVVNIFHHARFLEYHRDSAFFPTGLIAETVQTLALLLPTHDRSTRKWFLSYSRTLRLDPSALECGQLKLEDRQIDHFKYWHDRLVILKQYFDDSQPRTIKQWWYDDRKRVQWFWVAIVLVFCTILFGVVQCIEGGWQIWKAYYPSN